MSRRGSILQDYGPTIPVQPQDAQLAAANYYQRDKELAAQMGQQKGKDADADKWKKLKMIDDATDPSKYQSSTQKANSLATQQILALRNEYAGKTDLPPDQLYLELQQKLSPVAQGYNSYKGNLAGQEELAKEAVKVNPNLDLEKVLTDLQKEVDNEYLITNPDGTINFNQAKIGTQSKALDNILKPENAWKYSKGSKGLMDILKKGGEKGELFSQATDGTQINYTTNVPFWGRLVDEKGEPIEADPKTGLIPKGKQPRVALKGTIQDYEEVDDKGRPVKKSMVIVPQKTMDAILYNDELKYAFEGDWQKHKMEAGINVDPGTEDDLKRVYFSQVLADNGLVQPYVSSRTHLPPQPRTTINNRYGSGSDVNINDVWGKLVDFLDTKDGKNLTTDGVVVGKPMNEVPADARNVIFNYIKNTDINEKNSFIRLNDKGQIEVYETTSIGDKEVPIIDGNKLVTVFDRNSINQKTQPGAPEKREDLKNKQSAQPGSIKKFNVIDPNTGKVILSGVDQSAADKAKAKGYKIQ